MKFFNIKSVSILPLERGGYIVKIRGGIDGKESLSVYTGSFTSCVNYALDILTPEKKYFYGGKNDL